MIAAGKNCSIPAYHRPLKGLIAGESWRWGVSTRLLGEQELLRIVQNRADIFLDGDIIDPVLPELNEGFDFMLIPRCTDKGQANNWEDSPTALLHFEKTEDVLPGIFEIAAHANSLIRFLGESIETNEKACQAGIQELSTVVLIQKNGVGIHHEILDRIDCCDVAQPLEDFPIQKWFVYLIEIDRRNPHLSEIFQDRIKKGIVHRGGLLISRGMGAHRASEIATGSGLNEKEQEFINIGVPDMAIFTKSVGTGMMLTNVFQNPLRMTGKIGNGKAHFSYPAATATKYPI